MEKDKLIRTLFELVEARKTIDLTKMPTERVRVQVSLLGSIMTNISWGQMSRKMVLTKIWMSWTMLLNEQGEEDKVLEFSEEEKVLEESEDEYDDDED